MTIDPCDDNYFASAGPLGEPVISIWDRRNFGASSSGSSSFSGTPPSVSALEINNAVDARSKGSIRCLRFRGTERGDLAVLSSNGQLRLFNIAKRWPRSSFGVDYSPGGAEEESFREAPLWLKQSHDLRFSSKDKIHGKKELSPTIAFDFAPRSLADCESVVALRRDGVVELIRTSRAPAVVQMSSTGDTILQAQSRFCAVAPFRGATIAEDLLAIQEKIHKRIREIGRDGANETASEAGTIDGESMISEAYPLDEEMAALPSRERHERLLSFGFPKLALPLPETLTVADTQRRRCEEGYLFDCVKNQNIVRNDPWLVGMWDVVSRLEDLALDFKAGQEVLDLSYAGVHSIWTGSAGRLARSIHGRHGGDAISELDTVLRDFQKRGHYANFEGVKTSHPTRRILGLLLCGWLFDEKKLRVKCIEILNRGEPYKSIVVAFCHGRKRLAIEMVKLATRAKEINHSGLAAIIACDTVSKEQRSLCEWMAEDAKDPYLKALLTYFITAEWRSVADMAQLPLKYRVAVALQHLDDTALRIFLHTATEEVIKHGDVEGVLLTGIGAESMDLFQNYIDKTGDLQTAVLVNAFAVPLFTDEERWLAWKEVYFHDMQSWRAFIQRTRFTVQHSRRCAAQNPNKRVAPPPRQVTLRCMHCQKSIAKPELIVSQNLFGKQHQQPLQHHSLQQISPSNMPPIPTTRPAPTPAQAAGTVCPRCSRHLPRCSLCMLWLGAPDPAYSYSATGVAAGGTSALPPATTAAGLAGLPGIPEDELGLARFINFCMECGHGYHANHAREWFAKHNTCPVPDCQCLCALRR